MNYEFHTSDFVMESCDKLLLSQKILYNILMLFYKLLSDIAISPSFKAIGL